MEFDYIPWKNPGNFIINSLWGPGFDSLWGPVKGHSITMTMGIFSKQWPILLMLSNMWWRDTWWRTPDEGTPDEGTPDEGTPVLWEDFLWDIGLSCASKQVSMYMSVTCVHSNRTCKLMCPRELNVNYNTLTELFNQSNLFTNHCRTLPWKNYLQDMKSDIFLIS